MIRDLSEYRLILNGTPITKNEWDIYNQMEFLSDKIFNMHRSEFQSTFFKKIRFKKAGQPEREFYKLSEVNIDYLHKLINPYIFESDFIFTKSEKEKRIMVFASDDTQEMYESQKESLLKLLEYGDASVEHFINMAVTCFKDKKRHAEIAKHLKGQTFCSPVYNVKPVPIEKIQANSYNPNSVANPEMELLYQSIKEDGYTMPIVCYYLEDIDKYEIVDGFHRYTTMLNHKDIYERENGCLPVAVIDKPIEDRMASTIRHNRARGSHDISLMSNIISELVDSGMSDKWIMKNIGMDADELLRLKQVSGLAKLFVNKNFSKGNEDDY